MPDLADLNLAMGEFLTESSEVENLMLDIYITCNPDRPIGASYNEFSDQTFGSKIVKFKKVCDAYAFSEEERVVLCEIYSQIDALLSKRNYIIHGSTQKTPLGEPVRVGKKRKDLSLISRVFEQDYSGENVFTVDRIAETSEEFISTYAKMKEICSEMLKPWMVLPGVPE